MSHNQENNLVLSQDIGIMEHSLAVKKIETDKINSEKEMTPLASGRAMSHEEIKVMYGDSIKGRRKLV